MTYKYIFFISLFALAFFTCEDPIDVELSPTNGQVNIDAWLNNKSEPQTIKIRRVSPFFDSSPSPIISGASVIVSDDLGQEFIFEEQNNSGDYTWFPAAGEAIGEVGRVFDLNIDIAGKRYVSSSTMKRIMPINSLTTEFMEEELGQVEGIYAEVFARDFLGAGDTYWIQTFKNGVFLNKPNEISIVYDASFTAGGNVDGVTFISPIRTSVNRVPDPMDSESEDTSDVAPWAVGDSIRVEIHSINEPAFFFLEASLTQLTLGDAGIFAEPPANVPSNIDALDVDDPSDEAVGFFNVAAVSSEGRIIE